MRDASQPISVRVEPRYLPDQSSPDDRVYTFAYAVTVTNTGVVAAQLIARHWMINDASGHTQEVKGLGVIGQQPLLAPGAILPLHQRLPPAGSQRYHARQLLRRDRAR